MFMVYIRFKGTERGQEIRFARDLNSAVASAKIDFAVRNNIEFEEYGSIDVWGHKA